MGQVAGKWRGLLSQLSACSIALTGVFSSNSSARFTGEIEVEGLSLLTSPQLKMGQVRK